MIHTNTLVTYRSGLNLAMEPNVITSPSGSAMTSVSANISRFIKNPPVNDSSTVFIKHLYYVCV